ncbi:MAG: VPLPA-CTERM-specific exosortase XrtD [Pseudomonadota bacterium]
MNTRGAVSSRLGAASDWAGPALLLGNMLLAIFVFNDGFEALLTAWQVAEYSHGPLIPMLSGLLFLRQLKTVPVNTGPVDDRWPGIVVIAFSVVLGLFGKIAQIPDVVAYAIIVWIAGMLLVSFGWKTGRHFWPGVLHLVFMLPLPGLLYWKVSIFLRSVSSEFGVWLVQAANVPVYLDGNIIDLGVYKLHVADACSGLRYLFPIMSFSYIFATLYKGPTWHKVVLLLSAAPITVIMNSVRIGIIGVMVDAYGIDWAIGISHFMEGWVIFIVCVMMLFGMAQIMLMLQKQKMSLSEALDLDTTGLKPQIMRVRNVRPSAAMMSVTAMFAVVAIAWTAAPQRDATVIDRQPLALFPYGVEEWTRSSMQRLDPQIEVALGADDYYMAEYRSEAHAMPADVFIAWYADQTKGGIHSPEVCLPAGGWEIAELTRPDLASSIQMVGTLPVNRAIIEKGNAQMLVYYWFEQYGGRTARDFEAKVNLLVDSFLLGRSDGALVRLTTPIMENETMAEADARLQSLLKPTMGILERYVPRADAE